ncbi:MAG: hypothetical protein WEC12_08190 [Balneolaceae bacterium]
MYFTGVLPPVRRITAGPVKDKMTTVPMASLSPLERGQASPVPNRYLSI